MLPLTLALTWMGCASPEAQPRTVMSPVDHLVRASMALRGVRPSLAELDAVHADPSALDGIVRDWVDDPRLGETVRDLHAEQWLLRTDHLSKPPPVGDLVGHDLGYIAASLDEAPLRFVEHVVTSGRPYTDVVTADEAWANPAVAAAHGLAHDPAGPEWQASQWTDGRPAAGILSDTSVWQRHMSSDTNHHRARANFVAGALLCEDYLDRDVTVGVADLEDPYDAEARVATDPQCLTCHNTLDPLAAVFFGFRRYLLRTEIGEAHFAGCPPGLDHACYPLQMWDPDLVARRAELNMPEPAFYGQPIDGIAELGSAIADDPRFASCTARRFYSWLTQVPVEDVPHDIETELTQTLVDSGWDARELMMEIALHDSFRRLDGVVPIQTIRPEHLSRTVEALTGHRLWGDPSIEGCESDWYGCYGPVDMSVTDGYGFRALLGGVDGWDVTWPTHTTTPTAVLTRQWLAEEAAGVVVDHDLSSGNDPRLLRQVTAGTSSSQEVRAQLAALHWEVLAERAAPSDPRVDLSWQLWDAVHAGTGDPATAWKVVVAAMLQDTKVTMY